MRKLLKQMTKFSIGDRVKHKVFGEGDVVDIDGVFDSAKLTIAFDDIDDKKVIMSKFVKLLKQYEQETRLPIISYHHEKQQASEVH